MVDAHDILDLEIERQVADTAEWLTKDEGDAEYDNGIIEKNA